MTSEPSPRPWRVQLDMDPSSGNNSILDANGNDVVSFYDYEGTLEEANACLIVAAVNERDRLRDIVRRLADLSENLLANYECRYREDANSMAFVGNARNFIREARTAPGEAAP